MALSVTLAVLGLLAGVLGPGRTDDPGTALPVADRGIFADLDARVRLYRPPWRPDLRVVQDRQGRRWLAVGRTVVTVARPQDGAPAATLDVQDADGDGIPDLADVMAGARKTALDNAPYGSPYRTLAYPGGDVPRGEGVCTDVVIRALRNAGWDLQKLVHEDIAAAPAAYPMVRKANPHIDHRRVKTLRPWFQRHWTSRSVDPRAHLSDWLPGDVILMDTLARPGPDHIGIVSDRLGPSGLPLIVNSWTDGYRTAEMDLLPSIPVTHRFRPRPAGGKDGLESVTNAWDLTVPRDARQALLVTTPGWHATTGKLQRFQRLGATWRPVGPAVAVQVGHKGLAWGQGVLGGQGAGTKREGDGRSPAGVFDLGTAFSRQAPPPAVRWPWRVTTSTDRWVDDPTSPAYNTWQQQAGQPTWKSAEVLARPDALYDPALVVRYNEPPVPGRGSAIFLHVSSDPPGPTAGCTAMTRERLLEVLRWLRPEARPVLVQVPEP